MAGNGFSGQALGWEGLEILGDLLTLTSCPQGHMAGQDLHASVDLIGLFQQK